MPQVRSGRKATAFATVLAALVVASEPVSGQVIPRRNFPISIAADPEGQFALVGNEERAGEIWSLPDLKLVRVLEAEKRSYARWHPKQPRVVLFSTNLWIYSTENWRLLHHSVASFVDIAFHGDKSQLIGLQRTGDYEHSIFLSELEQNPQSSSFAISDPKPNRLLYAGNDRVVVLGEDGHASMWDLTSQAQVGGAEVEGMKGSLAGDVFLGTASPRIAWLSQDTGRVGVLSLPDLRPVVAFDAHKRGYGETVRFRPDGEVLASGGTYPDATVQLWDAASGAMLGRKTGVQALDLAWSADSQSLFVCDRQLESVRNLPISEILKPP